MIGDEKCELGDGRFATFPVRVGAAMAEDSPPPDRDRSAPSPNTDINDGNDANKDCAPAVTGMLSACTRVGDLLFNDDGGEGTMAGLGADAYPVALECVGSDAEAGLAAFNLFASTTLA